MKSDIRVVPVDVTDESALHTYYETFKAGSETGRTDPTTWSYESAKISASTPSKSQRVELYIAYDGESPVGAGDLIVPLLENEDILFFDFAVREAHRRRGVGSALFAYISEKARAESRTSLMTEINVTSGTEATAPAAAFLGKQGLTKRNTELRRQLALPVADEKLESLQAKAASSASDYRLVSWEGRTPDEYAEQYAHLKGLLISEVPTGDIEMEPEKWDVERLRESEEFARLKGRSVFTTVAVAADGTLAGHTQLTVPHPGATRATQNDTLVLGAHRGHRLGLATKVANLRLLAEKQPQVDRIDTWNASQNDAMVAVNDQLGFRIIEVCEEWQGDTPADQGETLA